MKIKKPNIIATSILALQSGLIIKIAAKATPSLGEIIAVSSAGIGLPLLTVCLVFGMLNENSQKTSTVFGVLVIIGILSAAVSVGGTIWAVNENAGWCYVASIAISLGILIIWGRKQ